MPQSSISWEFSCTDAHGNDLCYHNGTCSSAGNNSCVCPDGYVHDFEWFHFSNCVKANTSTRDFLIFYGVMLFMFAAMYVWKIHRRLKKAARGLGMMSFASLFGEIAMVIPIYFQGGCFEGCAIVSSLHFCFCTILAQQTILVSLTPIRPSEETDWKTSNVFNDLEHVQLYIVP